MLTKITDDFYINTDEIVFIDKVGKDIRVRFKDIPREVLVSVYTKEGKAIQKVLKTQYMMSMERKHE